MALLSLNSNVTIERLVRVLEIAQELIEQVEFLVLLRDLLQHSPISDFHVLCFIPGINCCFLDDLLLDLLLRQ